MEKIKVIIIDDEQDGRSVLDTLIKENCPTLKVLALCDSARSGLAAIRNHKPDLVFLDVEMPAGNGFSLLEELEEIDFEVIFVTAHSHYAIKAIKFSALDYLLKPIDKKELIRAINKFSNGPAITSNERASLFVKNLRNDIGSLRQMALPTREGYVFVNIDEIVRCEGDRNYTSFIFMNGQKIVSSKTLKEFEITLSDFNFVRVHKSHLINLKHVKKYIRGEGGTLLMADNSEIEVSRRNKEDFLRLFS
jgi:two-component system LytT family response regulator